MLRCSLLNFIISIIMAQERVFPIFLDGARQEVTGTADVSWDGLTSTIKLNTTGDVTVTVGNANVAGTIVHISNDVTQANIVELSSTVTGDLDQLTFAAKGEFATVMWTGSAWLWLGTQMDASAIADS